MSEENDGQERTEEPTDKRREDFRKQGKVANSREVSSVVVLAAAVGATAAWSGGLIDRFADLLREVLVRGVARPDAWLADPIGLLRLGAREVLVGSAPVFGAAFVAAFLVTASQVGLFWSTESLAPKAERLDPIQGLRNKLLSAQAAAEWVKSLLKAAIVGLVAWNLVQARGPELGSLALRPLRESVAWTGRSLGLLAALLLAVMVVPALADLAFQRFQLLGKMRMTREEMKRENKESMGDPHVRARRRRVALELSRNRLLAAVSEATVVITNPSHYAVALRYVPGVDPVPVVVARGLDERARLIKDLARTKGVPRVENRPLARALYSQVREGAPVPQNLWEAVSEVLAFVQGLRARRRAGGRARGVSTA